MLNYEFQNIIRDENKIYCFLDDYDESNCVSHRNKEFIKFKSIKDPDNYFKELTGMLSSIPSQLKHKVFSLVDGHNPH